MRFLTAGESHGPALVGVLEGLPSGIRILKEDIEFQLQRRKKGFGRGDRQKIETDQVEILSGIRHGLTLGSPISLLIKNRDFENWSQIMSAEPITNSDRQVHSPRPGHADLTGAIKYKFNDMRNVLERASARETAMRVAIGSLCRCFLNQLGITVYSRVLSIGKNSDSTSISTPLSRTDISQIESSVVHCLNKDVEEAIIHDINSAQKEGDTLGGTFEVAVLDLPIGLGSYVQWDRRIEGDLAKSIMSLNAITGVEVGLGFQASTLRGSFVHDELKIEDKDVVYMSNKSGGIQGGMTTGEPLFVRASMKPLSTLKKPLSSVDLKEKKETQAHFERSDVCAVPSAAIISESLVALVISEKILEKFGGDSFQEIIKRVNAWKEESQNKFF